LTPVSPAQTRPRVEGAREEEILDAAVELLLELGYDRLTMDQVATRARASKATLYRRWASKQSLVVDAVNRSKKAVSDPLPDTGNLRDDLVQAFCGAGAPHNLRVLSVVVSALQTDPEFARAFRAQFVAPRAAVTQQLYARAAERGELLPDVDLSVLGPALAGIVLHRAIVLGEQVTPTLVERVVDQIIIPAATGRRPTATACPPEETP
jgi:AcrR family transcriptional regulator